MVTVSKIDSAIFKLSCFVTPITKNALFKIFQSNEEKLYELKKYSDILDDLLQSGEVSTENGELFLTKKGQDNLSVLTKMKAAVGSK